MVHKNGRKKGLHLICIRQGDEWKMAFRTWYRLYEFQVLPFGLTNTPSTFQDMMNHVFSDMIDLGLLIYMDNILIYTKTEEEHNKLVHQTLERLQKNKLAVSPEKCIWKVPEVEFLGYIIGTNRIKMSTKRVQAILGWKTPGLLTEVQSFLGFANFYRWFIQNYSRVARPLTELTKGERKDFKWNKNAKGAFKELKERFTIMPILTHFDSEKPVMIETDASNFELGAVLSQ